MDNARTAWWLWPGLLSVVAPAVAMAWLYMFSYVWQINYLPWPAYAVLGLAVWMVYATDRLWDSRLRGAGHPTISVRHEFLWRHRRVVMVLIFLAGLAVLALSLWFLPVVLFHTYLWPALILVAAFFVLTSGSGKAGEIPYLRNLVAGLAFGYGTAMMAHIYAGSQGVFDLLFSRKMIGFSILCAVNMTAIHVWERAAHAQSEEEIAGAEASLSMPLMVVALSALVFACKENSGLFPAQGGFDTPPQPFFYAILVAAGLLLLLNRARDRFSLEAMRMLADLALIAPLPAFLILAHG